jgi:hypothetical protein
MKKLLLLFVLMSIPALSQTTTDEYNYMTKGYKMQIEGGLDAKSGYTLTDMGSFIVDKYYSFTYKYLTRDSDNTFIGVMISAKSGVSGNTYYWAIPVGNSQLLEKYYSDISELDKTMLLALTKSNSVMLSASILTFLSE